MLTFWAAPSAEARDGTPITALKRQQTLQTHQIGRDACDGSIQRMQTRKNEETAAAATTFTTAQCRVTFQTAQTINLPSQTR
jgi:hypothetical protein